MAPKTAKALNTSDVASPPKKQNLFYNPTFRAIVFQLIAVLGLLFFFYNIINNALENLDARGIATGFGFLNQEAGFGIGLTLIDYDETYTYGRTFFVGLLNTALVSVLGIFLATIIGFTVGIARLSSNWLISRFAALYIETFRNIPLLLQIFFWYFAVLQALPSPRQSLSIGESLFINVRGLYLAGPVFNEGSGWIFAAFALAVVLSIIYAIRSHKKQQDTGEQSPILLTTIGMVIGLPLIAFFAAGMPISVEYPELKGFNFRGGISILPELAALLVALSIYTASFIAEIVRSGINAVNHGQTEASLALGLPRSKTLRLVVIPQAMRIIIPPLTSQYLNLTKNSSLAMAIGYPDLVSVFAGTTLNQTGQAIEIIAMTMGVYLSLSLITSFFMNMYNKKVALVER
ncbi:amino acid ABC transporter permease [Photobacterium profundum]|jgi:general L-amino acid transport system permease protein|uniref:Putative amino acid ABC transporter, permease protein n=1 Tax=Photobacterium profundum 3TCK TaxID=314280 RepID=Q1Z8D4_9GAMM|nr:amino acid ABC transporter permease [Photobacterium profundum]EAS45174.1 putative amino acid ABC transporter, permease protein [Photobacterium profundum 3TCK]PSV60564.1 amino acid ABC transporter permease [Photobacterium profundum]